MLVCIGFTEILKLVDTVSTESCELNNMSYRLLPVGCFETDE